MYVKNETITGDGVKTEFTLAENFEPGTVLIQYNDFVFYKYYEETPNKIVFDVAPIATDVIKVSYYTTPQPYSENALRYATPEQVKTRSRVSDLVALTDAEIEVYIREAEIAIDAYISKTNKYYNGYNDLDGGENPAGQILKFPRIEDDLGTDNQLEYVGVLTDITTAALSVVENIFLQGDLTASTSTGTADLESEKLGDYSYKKRQLKYNNEQSFAYNAILGTKAKLILDKFGNMSARKGEMLIREDPNNYELLNSRQKFQMKRN